MPEYLVKLEYWVRAPQSQQAVDALTKAVRLAANGLFRDHAIVKTADLLRTDVRRPGEAGDW